MHQFPISRRLALTIKKNSDKIIDLATSNGNTLEIKTFWLPQFPVIDAEVYLLVSKVRSLKFPVTRAAITQQALLVHEKLLKSKDDEKYKTFTTSKGWVDNFAKGFGLSSVSLSGKAGSGDSASVLWGISKIREKLKSFSRKCISNVDKTGLLFKLLPRRT